VAVSRDGRWVASGDYNCVELKPCEVETGIVKKKNSRSHEDHLH
jgi:hypothetical protein